MNGSTALAERPQLDAKAIEQVLLGSDLSKLSADQRLNYYNQVCQSLGLNPLTKPFAYITLNGKLQLYALKDATEQLRKIHGVSITEVSSMQVGDVFVVTAKAADRSGRTDAATGAVAVGNLKGESLANALMKAETKAKRRATLSICGLGMLDETDTDTIPNAHAGEPLPPVVVEAEVSTTEPLPEPPDGYVYLRKTEQLKTSRGKPYWLIVTHTGEEFVAWDEPVGAGAEWAVQQKRPVQLQVKGTWDGKSVIRKLSSGEQGSAAPSVPMPTAEEIPF